MRVQGEQLNGRHVIGVCRSSYGNVLTARGEWTKAELELTDALVALEATRPGVAPAGLVARAPRHDVRDAGPDLLLAPRTPVLLRRCLRGDRAHQPLAVRVALLHRPPGRP